MAAGASVKPPLSASAYGITDSTDTQHQGKQMAQQVIQKQQFVQPQQLSQQQASKRVLQQQSMPQVTQQQLVYQQQPVIQQTMLTAQQQIALQVQLQQQLQLRQLLQQQQLTAVCSDSHQQQPMHQLSQQTSQMQHSSQRQQPQWPLQPQSEGSSESFSAPSMQASLHKCQNSPATPGKLQPPDPLHCIDQKTEVKERQGQRPVGPLPLSQCLPQQQIHLELQKALPQAEANGPIRGSNASSCSNMSTAAPPSVPSQSGKQTPSRGCTTWMLRNIPVTFTRESVLADLDTRGFRFRYDFFYLPIDFQTGNNLGYAFINFVEPNAAEQFCSAYQGLALAAERSKKVCAVAPATTQGRDANVDYYRNSPVMSMEERYHPLLLEGGVRQPFPAPTKAVKPMRLRARKGAQPEVKV